MSFAAYRAQAGVNWSTLKAMRDSPLAYRYAMDNPPADKEAFAIGRAVHALVFEPETFEDRFVIWDGGTRAGAKWKAFEAEHADRTILRAQDDEWVRAIAGAVNTHPIAVQHIAGGIAETPIGWTDPATGMQCKALPDCIKPDSRVLLDLKTTRSVDGRRFGAEAARFAYAQQLAYYEAACTHGLGWTPERVLIVAVEKQAPYDVGVFEIDQQAREIAAVEVAALLARLKECTERDEWPGRYAEEQALQLPAWVYADDDEDDADGFGLSFGG